MGMTIDAFAPHVYRTPGGTHEMPLGCSSISSETDRSKVITIGAKHFTAVSPIKTAASPKARLLQDYSVPKLACLYIVDVDVNAILYAYEAALDLFLDLAIEAQQQECSLKVCSFCSTKSTE